MFKKIILTCLLLLPIGILLAQQLPPKSTTLVTDYTNTLALQDKDALEAKLVAFNDSTSTQIAVVIMKSVGSYDIAQYGTALGRAWGIGQQGKNNGILILVALDDHKVTIQTGYGAEAAVPDAVTSRIIEQDLKPNFRQNNYYAGLDVATTSLLKYMKGEYKADGNAQDQDNVVTDQGGSNGSGIGILIFIVIVVVILVFRNMGGGGGHIIGRSGSASPFWWFLAGSALGGSNWGGNSGGSDSGGGGFGGGSSGGGFGGFGGGSFGGGGSSGSW